MRYLLAFFLFFGSGFAAHGATVPTEEADRLEQVFQTGKFATDTTTALDALVNAAADRLEAEGLVFDAQKVRYDWNMQYHDFLTSKNVGDHAPIQWLYGVWSLLNETIGPEAMKETHLDDLWEFAYTIPVVFWCEDHVDSAEFAFHFIMFAGATSYWVTEAVCAASMFGSPFALLCSPAAEICERIMVNRIAPRISPSVWGKVCR